MIFSPLQSIIKTEKPALLFLLKLLLLLAALKCIFFFYNYGLANGWQIRSLNEFVKLCGWSILYDFANIAIINLLLLLLLAFGKRLFINQLPKLIIVLVFTALNTFNLLLNTVDIFYYRFHLQRADADLLYVLRNPFENGTIKVLLILLAIVIFLLFIGRFVYKNIKKILEADANPKRYIITSTILFFTVVLFIGSKFTVPTYPLTAVKPVQLPLTQNSFHSFIYSLHRRNELQIPDKQYMSNSEQQRLFSINKKNNTASNAKKNIVLFIMEGVPKDFFDSGSPYKANIPFLDSIISKGTYYSNAFSYAYTSNKGITALLAGIPTMTDIPLYHSNFVSIDHTAIGSTLAKNGYSSAFFIGDNYDDFGFAKFCNWAGIQHYYCMQDIPGYQQMEKHSMGLHDEYVLNFMEQKIATFQQPFFAVQFNISTHYPHDLPKSFKERPTKNPTPQMKTMQYYNDCIQHFFDEAAKQPWYKNSVFIFCSDHWTQPHRNHMRLDEETTFRIPLFIYNPSDEEKSIVTSPVSQLDVMNTILYYSGFKDSLISYGINLKDSALNPHRTVFTKTNTAIYEAINDEYVLGFDAVNAQPVYLFNYKKDPEKKMNLIKQSRQGGTEQLIAEMEAFLQTASNHYRHKKTN